MPKIINLKAREILDSRGYPTVEVEVFCENGVQAKAIVPSGASTGTHEAMELRDGDPGRFFGKGVQKAVESVNKKIFQNINGMEVCYWKEIDRQILLLDGTKNKTHLGANAILGVSLACAKASALANNQAFYHFLGGKQEKKLPIPLMNVLNGGIHADNNLEIQEFMIVPCLKNFKNSLRAGSEIFHYLKKLLSEKNLITAVGDEGGFAPKLDSNEVALDLLCSAIERAGYLPGEEVFLALDVASTEFYKKDHYLWENCKKSSGEMIEIYEDWQKKYPLISIEDGLSENDWTGWIQLTQSLGKKIQLVGDDLFVTNFERLEKGIDQACANALLVKPNQIGSLSETIKAVELAQNSHYETVMSHRSGETEDVSIADLSVALGCSQIKTGSLCRSERVAKYNQLLRIEEALGDKARFPRHPFHI